MFSCDNYDRVPAKKLEAVVNKQIEKLFLDEKLAKDLIGQITKRHKDIKKTTLIKKQKI